MWSLVMFGITIIIVIIIMATNYEMIIISKETVHNVIIN